MEIAIRSEVDSRVLVYPLIKVLATYGTVAVYTSNKFFSRLIENELEGGFKNIRIVVSPEEDIEAAKESDEYYKNKYDYLILDNMGASDYDMMIAIVTSHLSDNYTSDLLYIISEEKTHIIKFGSPAKGAKDAKKPPKKPKKGEEPDLDDDEFNSFNKWDNTKTDEEILKELLADRESKWVKFPTFEAIENMEARHIFITPDDTLIKELFRLFGESLSIDERMFTKGARVKDESSSSISGTDIG